MSFERSRGGCASCKRRHIKCDETRPQCKKCTSKHLQCPGFNTRFVWKNTVADEPQHGAAKKRTRSSHNASSSSTSSFSDTPGISLSAVKRGLPASTQQSVGYGHHNDQAWNSELEAATGANEPTQDGRLDEGHVGPATSETRSPLELDSAQLPRFESAQGKVQDMEGTSTATLLPGSCNEHVTYQGSYSISYVKSPHAMSRNTINVHQPTDLLFGPSCAESSASPTFTVNSDSPLGSTIPTAAPHCEDVDDFVIRNRVHGQHESAGENVANAEEPPGMGLGSNHLTTGFTGPTAAGWALSANRLSPGFLDLHTTQNLTLHYFDTVCLILSCFDSNENPFRSDIPRVMLTCDYFHDCVIGLSAAHLANKVDRMEGIALNHQSRAMAGLSMVIEKISIPAGNGQVSHNKRLSQSARYQALLAAILLGISSAWYDASAASLTHLFGARSLFQAWLADEATDGCIEEPALLNRQQSFLVGTMVYLECLAAFILDQSIDSLRHLRRFGATAGRQRIHPNPWTGVSTPLFVHLAETAILMRCKRTCSTYHSTRPQRDSSVDLWDTINQTAKDLYERILKYRPPSANMVDDTKDPNTPVDHLISVDIIHRFVILMELVQAFPGLSMGSNWETSNETAIATQASELAFDCAVAILNIVSQLPENSGANIMLSIPLIAAGSALQTRQRPESPQSPETPHGIRDSTFAVMRGRAMVEIWREQTQSRLERTYRRVGVAPLLRASQLLQQVWQRADSVTREDERDKSPFSVHWMSIMTAESLETLFG